MQLVSNYTSTSFLGLLKQIATNVMVQNSRNLDFSSSLVIKTQCSHLRGMGSVPYWGTNISHVWQKKKKKKEKTAEIYSLTVLEGRSLKV